MNSEEIKITPDGIKAKYFEGEWYIDTGYLILKWQDENKENNKPNYEIKPNDFEILVGAEGKQYYETTVQLYKRIDGKSESILENVPIYVFKGTPRVKYDYYVNTILPLIQLQNETYVSIIDETINVVDNSINETKSYIDNDGLKVVEENDGKKYISFYSAKTKIRNTHSDYILWHKNDKIAIENREELEIMIGYNGTDINTGVYTKWIDIKPVIDEQTGNRISEGIQGYYVEYDDYNNVIIPMLNK